MNPAPLPSLLEQSRRLRLLDEARLTQVADALPPGLTEDAAADWLVRHGVLTAFQADRFRSGAAAQLAVGPYRLLEPLAADSPLLFRARHAETGQVVALRALPPEQHDDAAALERLRQEMDVAARLRHPKFLRPVEAEPGRPYFALEDVPGVDLGRVVREAGPLPPAQACDYAHQAAQALQHLAEQGLVHGGLEPAALLVTFDAENVYLLGPGRERTAAGRDFEAPERAAGGPPDVRGDIYSLGAVLFYLLTGRAPAQQKTTPNPRQLRPDVPAPLAVIVQKMLAARPQERYKTLAAVVVALAPFAPKTAPRLSLAPFRAAAPSPLPAPVPVPKPVAATAPKPAPPPAPAPAPEPVAEFPAAPPPPPDSTPLPTRSVSDIDALADVRATEEAIPSEFEDADPPRESDVEQPVEEEVSFHAAEEEVARPVEPVSAPAALERTAETAPEPAPPPEPEPAPAPRRRGWVPWAASRTKPDDTPPPAPRSAPTAPVVGEQPPTTAPERAAEPAPEPMPASSLAAAASRLLGALPDTDPAIPALRPPQIPTSVPAAAPKSPDEERRGRLRRRGNVVPILLAVQPDWEEPLRGWVLNRSTGGLGLLVEEPLEVGSQWHVRPAAEDFEKYWFPVKIVSCTRDHLRWRVGIQFLKSYSWSDLRGFG